MMQLVLLGILLQRERSNKPKITFISVFAISQRAFILYFEIFFLCKAKHKHNTIPRVYTLCHKLGSESGRFLLTALCVITRRSVKCSFEVIKLLFSFVCSPLKWQQWEIEVVIVCSI